MKRVSRIVVFGCFVHLLCVAALVADSYSNNVSAEYAVVLGNKVELSGQPSARLEARLLAAFDLYHRQSAKRIIVSGGLGKEGFDEALVMANYLIAKGVSAADIITDSNGYNTHSTALSVQALVANKSAAIVVVSQQYHVSRSKLSLRNAGFTNVQGHFPKYYEVRDIYAYTREIAAWAKYWALGL